MKFRSKQIVDAEQYWPGSNHKLVTIGKNDPTNRWDDTPDGPFIQMTDFKRKVEPGNWIVIDEDTQVVRVYSDEYFKSKYESCLF